MEVFKSSRNRTCSTMNQHQYKIFQLIYNLIRLIGGERMLYYCKWTERHDRLPSSQFEGHSNPPRLKAEHIHQFPPS